MNREEEILKEIAILEEEERKLSQTVHVQALGYHDAYSDQKYGFEDYYEQKGTSEQIQNVQEKIRRLKEELERLRTYPDTRISNEPQVSGHDILDEPKNNQKKNDKANEESKKLVEAERIRTFKQVKQAYKKTKGRTFEKFMDFIEGRKPNWKKISGYTQKELDYLLDTLRGETYQRQSSIRNIENNKKLSFAEQKRRISTSNWDAFTLLLRRKDLLNQNIELEAKKGRR